MADGPPAVGLRRELTARSGHQRPPRPARRLPGCLLCGCYGRLRHAVWRV